MIINQMKLKNFKQFKELDIHFNKEKNILIGENSVGKSSIISAISYVLNGSYNQIENIGFRSLFNTEIIAEFMNSDKKYDRLPILEIELFINNDIQNPDINGVHNTEKKELNGLKMSISPNDDLSKEINEALNRTLVFPFDYYKLEFVTFSAKSYNSYKKYKNHVKYNMLDSTKTSTQSAVKNYIRKIYSQQTDITNRQRINHSFRELNETFSNNLEKEFGVVQGIEGYEIVVDSSFENSFEERITIRKNAVDIRNLGQGETIFINTEYALNNGPEGAHVVLIEEPENHLSHLNMYKLIDKIRNSTSNQTFITTHSNMITSRLELKNAIFLKNSSHTKLENLQIDTSEFFQKSPNQNVLNFILANKSILVEGDAEYILLDYLYKKKYGVSMHEDDITLISCGGKTFKRYLEIANNLNIKVAVITDNDKDYDKHIIKSYNGINNNNIKIYAPVDNKIWTFEKALYNYNQELLEEKFSHGRMSNGLEDYMLANKAENAFRILKALEEESEFSTNFTIPKYIEDAFEWIRL